MQHLRLIGEPEIVVELRRNARARRLSLRVSQLDGRVTLTLPGRASQAEAQGFVQEKERWIRRQLDRRLAEIVPQIGATVLFEGGEVTIAPGRGRSVQLERGELLVPGDHGRVALRIAAFLKVMARQRLSAACDHYCALQGQQMRRLTLRDTRSRWGSCTQDGNLMFSWRLIMAPAAVLDYVAAHEVAHLREMNHSPRFWALVADNCPGYQAPRRWLRQNGAQLHAYRFVQLTTPDQRDHMVPC